MAVLVGASGAAETTMTATVTTETPKAAAVRLPLPPSVSIALLLGAAAEFALGGSLLYSPFAAVVAGVIAKKVHRGPAHHRALQTPLFLSPLSSLSPLLHPL